MVRNNYLTEHGICCNIDEVKSWEGKNIRTALKERMEEKLSHIATLNEEFKQMESELKLIQSNNKLSGKKRKEIEIVADIL